ncbi:MAG: alpha/beta fold hydrolase, partial [Mesorhizobium sp.]
MRPNCRRFHERWKIRGSGHFNEQDGRPVFVWADERVLNHGSLVSRISREPSGGSTVNNKKWRLRTTRASEEVKLRHRQIKVDGNDIFYREDGPADGPVLLLPHGYPCSSYQFRRLMPALADRWHTISPDFPGFGYSATPEISEFGYDFDAYAGFLAAFADALGLRRYALWLHDYGSQIGLRHAIANPERIAALIIQNGDIYEDVLGPKYAAIKAYWNEKTPQKHRPLEEAVSEEGFKHEFIGEVSDDVAERVPPDLWKLHWPLMD